MKDPQSSRDLGKRLRFEIVISEVLARFLNADRGQLGREIKHALRRIARFIGFDQAILVQWGDDTRHPVPTHSWTKPRCLPVPVASKPARLPWLHQRTLSGKIVSFSSLEALPAASPDKRFFRRVGVNGLISCPLQVGGRAIGALVLTTHRVGATWPEDTPLRMKMLADVFAGAIEQERHRREVEEGLRFEALMAELSMRFINLPADKVDGAIEKAQREFCEHLGLDRSSLFQHFEPERGALLLTHFYQNRQSARRWSQFEKRTDPGLASKVYSIKRITRSKRAYRRIDAKVQFPWVYRQIRKGKTITIADADELPKAARLDRDLFRRIGTQSSLIVPLFAAGAWLGCLTVATVGRTKSFPPTLVKRFETLAHIFANALARKRADAALRESEEHLSVATESAGAGLWSMQLDTRQIWVNTRMRQLMQFGAKEELTFDKFVQALHPEDRQLIIHASAQAAKTGAELRVEHRVLLPNGDIRWLSGRGRCVRDGNGKPDRLSGASIDITEQKLAELALKQSEENLTRLLQESPVAIGVARNDLVTFVNRKYLEIFGYENSAEVCGRSVLTQWAPESRKFIAERLRRRRRGLTVSQEYEGIGLRKDGSTINVLAAPTYVLLKDGPASVVFITDITDRKRAENALRQSEQRFREVAEIVGDFIWEVDAAGLYTYTSPSVERILGYTPQELVGKKHFYDLFVPDRREKLKADASRVFARQQGFRAFHNPNRHKDGRLVHLETSGVPLLDGTGKLIGYRGADVDVTERLRAQEALRESEEKFRSLHESMWDAFAVTDLNGGIVHFNSAFQQMLGFSAEELRRLTYKDITPERWHAPEQAILLNRVLTRGYSDIYEKEYRRKDGTVFPVELRSFRMQDRTGKTTGAWAIVRDITERKLSEQILRESEERFRTLVENAGDGVQVLDEDGTILDVNAARVQQVGYTREELLKMSVFDLDPGLERDRFEREGGALKIGVPLRLEMVNRRKDGSTFPVEVTVSRIQIGGRNCKMAILRDITDRKRAEIALRQNEERLRLVLEANSEGVWDWNIQTGRAYFSPRYAALLGYTPEEFPTDYAGWKQLVHPEDFASVHQAHHEHLYHGKEFCVEFRMRKKDGEWRWVRSRGTVVERDADGFPLRMVGTHLDVTARKQAEALAKESETRFAAMANAAPVFIWATGPDGMCTFVNEPWLEFTGHSLEQELGERWAENIHPDDREGCLKVFAEAFGARRPFSLEYRLRRHDGQYRWMSDHGVARYDEEQRFVGYVGSVLDVTERKAAETEAQRSRQELAHVGRVSTLGELGASLAHELNQPLTSILSNAEAAQDYLKATPADLNEVRAIIDDIVQQGRRAGDVIVRMRAMLRKDQTHMQPLDLNGVLRDVLSLLRSELVVRNVRVVTRLATRLPPVLGDRVQLQQLMLNLLMNACEAMNVRPDSAPRLIVETKRLDPNQVQVAITDSGPGFPPKVLERAFEPFQTTKPQGLGLGLAICRSILNTHNGKIWLANNDNGGATVSFVLPVKAGEKN